MRTKNKPQSNDDQEGNFVKSVGYIRNLFGDQFDVESIEHHLRGADGDIEIAINHLLNDMERIDDKQIQVSHGSTPLSIIENKSGLASSTVALKRVLCDLAEEVKCSLCLGYFNRPVALDCFHTFCSECVEDIVVDGLIQCPLCRSTMKIGAKGVQGLKYNHYLANIVGKLKAAQSTKMCAECDSLVCSVLCQECEAFLCDRCNDKLHNTPKLHKHNRIPFEDCFFNTDIAVPYRYQQISNILWEVDCVVPFTVPRASCEELFYGWLRDLWFAPTDLESKARLQEIKLKYIPYWLFEVEAVAKFSFLLHSPSPVDKDDERGEWKYEESEFQRNFTDVIVCAATSPEASLLPANESWQMNQIVPFTLKHAENVDVCAFNMGAETAWYKEAKERLEKISNEEGRHQLQQKHGLQRLRDMAVETSFNNRKSRRLFVPAYCATYTYRGKEFRVVINGSMAKVHGERPRSIQRLTALSVTGLGTAISFLTRTNRSFV